MFCHFFVLIFPIIYFYIISTISKAFHFLRGRIVLLTNPQPQKASYCSSLFYLLLVSALLTFDEINLAEGNVELPAELIGTRLFQLVLGELLPADFINIPTLFKFQTCILNFFTNCRSRLTK